MTPYRSRLYQPALLAAMIPLLALSGLMQRRLNEDRVGLGQSGLGHGLQYLHQVQRSARSLAMGAARYRAAARRGAEIQSGRAADLSRVGLDIPAQDRRGPGRRPCVLQIAMGARNGP